MKISRENTEKFCCTSKTMFYYIYYFMQKQLGASTAVYYNSYQYNILKYYLFFNFFIFYIFYFLFIYSTEFLYRICLVQLKLPSAFLAGVKVEFCVLPRVSLLSFILPRSPLLFFFFSLPFFSSLLS